MAARFACSGSESPALVVGAQLEVVVVVAAVAGILALVVARAVESIAVAAPETSESVDVAIQID